MNCSVKRPDLVISPGENVLLENGEYGRILLMKGGDLEIGEDVVFEEVVMNAGTDHEVSVRT